MYSSLSKKQYPHTHSFVLFEQLLAYVHEHFCGFTKTVSVWDQLSKLDSLKQWYLNLSLLDSISVFITFFSLRQMEGIFISKQS